MPQQLTGKVEFLNDDGQTVVTIDPINSPQLKITPPGADIAEVRNGELAADRVSVHIISVDRISVDNVIVGSTDHPGVFEIRNSDFPGVRFSDLTHRTQCSISVGRATKATYASETTPIASGYTSMQGKARYS
jgi:hypothetical protein